MNGPPRRDADADKAVRALVAVGVPEAQAQRCVAGQHDPAEGAGDGTGPDCPVLRENWRAVRVFVALGTQWRYRAAGMASVPAGLDYGVLPGVLRMMGVRRKRWPAVFEQLRVMEASALEAMRARAPG